MQQQQQQQAMMQDRMAQLQRPQGPPQMGSIQPPGMRPGGDFGQPDMGGRAMPDLGAMRQAMMQRRGQPMF